MRVIAKKILREFWIKHPNSEQQLKAWFREAEKGNWSSPNHIKDQFPNVRIIPGNRVIFNIKGNEYRLVVKLNYNCGMMWIRFIGTHDEYDKINSTKV